MLEKLDYVAALGVDAIWLTPFYPSADADLGYDVTDHTAVDPRLGTLQDVDRLLTAAHARGLRVLLDLVLNHTSDRHPWFAASPEMYLRRPGVAGVPPNNWRSMAGGSAWTFDGRRGDHYLHTFLPAQPDLDWRSPAVRAAMADVMRFWLARGVDGFRLDALPVVIKDAAFRDEAPGTREHTVDQPEMTDVIRFLRAVVDEYDDRLLVAEMGLPPARAARYYEAIHVPFNFGLITSPWTAPRLARRIAAHLEALPAGAAPNWVLGNHDVHRLATRLGPARARVAALIGLTLPGTVTLYAGDELGLPDGPPAPGGPRDAFVPPRDGARAPMPWDGSANGGFSAAVPWLPAYPDAATLSVAAQEADPSSFLSLYRHLLALRREHGWAGGAVTGLRHTDDELVFDNGAHRIVARIASGPLDAPGRVILRARDAPDGPNALVVER